MLDSTINLMTLRLITLCISGIYIKILEKIFKKCDVIKLLPVI